MQSLKKIHAWAQMKVPLCMVLSRLLIFFSKSTLLKNFFQEYRQSVNSLDPDHNQHLIRTDLGPNYLQMLSKDNTDMQSVTIYLLLMSADNLCKRFGPRSGPDVLSGLIWIQNV